MKAGIKCELNSMINKYIGTKTDANNGTNYLPKIMVSAFQLNLRKIGKQKLLAPGLEEVMAGQLEKES